MKALVYGHSRGLAHWGRDADPGLRSLPGRGGLMRGGAGVTQVAAFVSSLMMVGVVTLPMEMRYFGRRAALMRNALAWLFSLAAAVFVGWTVSL